MRLGMISGVMLPPALLASALDWLASHTHGRFGVNFLMPFLDRGSVAVAAERARVVEFFYGTPETGLVDVVHSGGALASWQVGSVGEAVAAARAGCDFVVVTCWHSSDQLLLRG
jgi:nitronate monooxygenase